MEIEVKTCGITCWHLCRLSKRRGTYACARYRYYRPIEKAIPNPRIPDMSSQLERVVKYGLYTMARASQTQEMALLREIVLWKFRSLVRFVGNYQGSGE